MLLVLFAAFLAAAPAAAQTPEEQSAIARKQKVAALLSSAQGPATDRAPRIAKANGGYVRHVGFPRGCGVEAIGADAQDPRDVTEKFLGQWRDAFVNPSAKVHFETIGVNAHRGRSYIWVQQKYGGLRIFAAEMNVQVGADGRVNSVLCNVMRDTGVLDRGELSTTPNLTAEAAQSAAIQLFSNIADAAALAAFTASPPELLLFHPPILDQQGPTRLVWSTVVQHLGGEPLLSEQVLVDAQTGEIPLRFSLILNGKYREIYDQDGDPYYGLRTLIRDDGQHQGESGIPEVNRAFDLFGYIYDLYWDWHGRDSYDDVGQHIRVGVRMAGEDALWEGGNQNIFIGTLLFDDVSMHEYTHGVSQHLGLGWTGETLALHESFSDMWGDWFDQEHNFVNLYGYTNLDGGDYDWLNAEDRGDEKGAYRSMKDPPTDTMIDPPPLQHSPDRYKGPNWQYNDDSHSRCGVGNKLCYLLTDGQDPFNGFTILRTDPNVDYDLRRKAAAELFYEARLHLSGSVGYHDLYSKLMDAAETLGYSDAQKLNLEKACQAVNIRTSNVGLTLKNTSGDTRGFLQDAGQLLLKKTLTPQAQSPIDTSNGGLIIRDTSGTVVAFINASAGENGGEMKILGGLTDANDDLPPESSDNLLIVRYEGVIVTAIDKYGNLKIWGEVEQNHTF
jgi:Zn-dependent metalloprotease